jgi:ankyrin repeat protein
VQGADPWAVDKLGGRTALHYAARSDNTEILELLVEAAGSSGRVQFPNRPNTRSAHTLPFPGSNTTALGSLAADMLVNSSMQAAVLCSQPVCMAPSVHLSERPDVVALLLSLHVRCLLLCSYVDVRTQAGFTAVHFAVQAHSQQTLAVLLNMGANPLLSTLFDCLDTINCPKGTTPLHLAARQGSTGVAKQLLRAYVSVPSQTRFVGATHRQQRAEQGQQGSTVCK